MRGRVRFDREPLFHERVHDVHRFGDGGIVQGVLLQDVAGDREKIGFGVADLVVAFDPQKAQENFLCKVSDVRGIAESAGQKAPQSLAVLGRDIGYEETVVVCRQVGSNGSLAQTIRALRAKNRLPLFLLGAQGLTSPFRVSGDLRAQDRPKLRQEAPAATFRLQRERWDTAFPLRP